MSQVLSLKITDLIQIDCLLVHVRDSLTVQLTNSCGVSLWFVHADPSVFWQASVQYLCLPFRDVHSQE